jgi:amino acid adenylation domain-containing protein/non-ribosomal peptide synthase protein (TIGR01720 family)
MDRRIFHTVVEHVVERFPTKVAIEHGEAAITYAALNRRANCVAHHLRQAGVGQGEPVAIYLPPGIDYVVALLGVAKAGAVFLPLDSQAPQRRFEHILHKADVKLIVTHDPLVEALQGRLQTLAAPGAIRGLVPPIDGEAAEANPEVVAGPDDGCYIMFTSGSTGEPKAILGCQKGLGHFLHWEVGEFELDDTLRGSQLAPTTFDVSLRDILVPLSVGGTLCIPDEDMKNNYDRLLHWMQKSRLTLVHCVPTVFRLLLKALETRDDVDGVLPDLCYVLLAGEPLYGSDVMRWQHLFGDRIELVNLYGPSETTLAKAFHRIREVPAEPDRVIPVGKPIANTALLILQDQRLCGIGEIGEIFIKTPFATKGYYRDDALTAASFIQNPLRHDGPDRIYKTGDLGRYREDRSVEVLGRLDQQVKVHGVRVELAEIEAAVRAHPAVDLTAVVAHRGPQYDYTLVCYYTAEREIGAHELRRHLQAYLLDAMMPSVFIRLAELPQHLNGKIDRRALPQPEALLYENHTYEAPETDMETRLARLWGENLGLDKVGVNHPFFEVGGNSLKAVHVLSGIYREFGVDISLRDFFEAATIRQLARRLAQSEPSALAAIEPVPPQTHYDLSYAQRRLWILDQMHIDSVAYNLPEVLEIIGHIDIAALQHAFQGVVDRHESLRTTFVTVDGEPKQRIHDAMEFRLETVDLSQEPHADKRAEALMEQDKTAPFDLGHGPLLRVKLLTLRHGFPGVQPRHLLLFNIHHIISDVWSLNVLVQEVLALYRSEVDKVPCAWAPLKFHYKDYAAWQNALLQTDAARLQRDYWHDVLQGELPVLELPTDFPRPAVQTFNGTTLSHTLDPQLYGELRRMSRSYNVSLFMLLSALVKTLLYRYSYQEDIIVGTPVVGRPHPDLDNQIGFYVNTLALRDQVVGTASFRALLQRVNQTTTAALAHQGYPFDCLVDELDIKRDMSRSPLFDVMVVVQDFAAVDWYLEHVSISPFGKENAWNFSRFDLVFHAMEHAGALRLDINYNTDLFKSATVQAMARHVEQLARAVVEDVDRPVQALSMLSAQEQQQLLSGINQGVRTPPPETTLVDAFVAQVHRSPQAPAVCGSGRVMSYETLNACANRLAHALQGPCRVGAQDRVGVLASRDEWLVIALLGILKAGAIYVPIDPDYPAERIGFILHDSQCRLVLSAAEPLSELPDGAAAMTLDIRTVTTGPVHNPPHALTVDSPAYMIYTSGSTGTPKGVLVEHGGFVNMIQDQIEAFGVGPQARVVQFASASFDASLSEIFMALLAGAALYPIHRDIIHNSVQFTQWLAAQHITVATLPPVYLRALDGHPLPSLQTIITAGEAANVDDALRYARGRRYFNAYGPTESSVCASYHRVDAERDYGASIPIGKPIRNTSIYVLNDALQPVPMGVVGEICIGGLGLARGYWRDEDRTAEKFVPHPFVPGERMYRTGDLGKWNTRGELIFLGRKDDQVKIAGHRIEPAEIEHVLRQHPGVDDAFVLAHGGATSQQLVAYIKPKFKVELWPSVAEFFVYDDIVYGSMAGDESRNARYLATFERLLPGKTVVEVGPGPELILSRLSLQAGARKVYAIELLPETYVKAKATLEALGLGDRITLMHGDARFVELPERVDYCVSEIVGAIGGAEGAAKIINDCRRFLHDPSHMIPQRSSTRIAAISLPEESFAYGFSDIAAHYVEQIFAQMGYRFDLRLCLKHVPLEALLTTSAIFEELNYTREMPLEAEHDILLTCERSGVVNGFLVWLNLYTDADHVVDILTQRESWLPVYMPISLAGFDVERGDTIRATISRRLCDNGLNPDYHIQGQLCRSNRPPVPFQYDSYHSRPRFKASPFYQKLFAQDATPILRTTGPDDVRHFLEHSVPAYMIPSHVIEIESVPLTPNGKIDRHALPVPATADAAKVAYQPPETDLEKRLARVWAAVLGREPIGIDENYFSLGGDSIKAIQIVAQLYQEDLHLDVRDILQHPTIAELAPRVGRVVHHIEQGPVIGKVPKTPIQRWFFEHVDTDPHHFNQALLLRSETLLCEGALRAAFAALQQHHDALRMRYRVTGSRIVQENAGLDHPVAFASIDLSHLDYPEKQLAAYAEQIQASFDLEHGPLIKCTLFRCGKADAVLLVSHHLVVDGVSWRILLEDLACGYRQYRDGEPISLPRKTDSFQRYAKALHTSVSSGAWQAQATYWAGVAHAPTTPLPCDMASDDARVADAATQVAALSDEETEMLLTGVHHAYNTGINDLLLTALGLALQAWCGSSKTLITLEGHGREHVVEPVDISRTVGWFTHFYPFVLELPQGRDIGYQIKSIKEALRQVPQQGMGYGLLRYGTGDEQTDRAAFHVSPRISFNFLGHFVGDNTVGPFTIDWHAPGQPISPQARRVHDLDVLGMIIDHRLEMTISYNNKRYWPGTVQQLLASFMQALRLVIRHCQNLEQTQATPSDFSHGGLSIEELDNILESLS